MPRDLKHNLALGYHGLDGMDSFGPSTGQENPKVVGMIFPNP